MSGAAGMAVRRAARRPGRGVALALALALGLGLAAGPGAAQQFDSLLGGDNPFSGVDLTEGVLGGDGTVPSLEDDAGLVVDGGPGAEDGIGLVLDPEGGQDGVALQTFPGVTGPVTSVSQPVTRQAEWLTLRAIDRMAGRPTDLELQIGQTVLFGRIAIRVLECRYPEADPSSDAYALIRIADLEGRTLFDGWMVASSPALNALEHPRYDVWVLRCISTP